MTELIVNGQRVRVSDDFLSLSPQEQERTVEEIAASLPKARSGPALSQLNLGVADAVGGLVDFVNPFDTPAVSQAAGLGDRLSTGSAREGLISGMQAIGAAGEDRAPEGIGEAMLRGGGQAAGAVIPATGVARVASSAPGLLGTVAGQINRGLSSVGGTAAEVAAGAASGGAMEATRDATEGNNLPDWANDLLVGASGVAGPMALAGGLAATQAVGRAANSFSPVAAAVRGTAATVAPYTRRGAEAVARRRMEELAGGRDRAMELGERINPNDEFGLSPAQQTGDQNMIALEQAAAQDPILRERLDQGLLRSTETARGAVDEIGGNVTDAQAFIRERRAQYTTELRAVAQQAVQNAEVRLQSVEAQRRPSENSRIVMEEISRALDVAKTRERELWASVPRAATVGTGNARAATQSLLENTPQAQRNDFPQVASDLLLSDDGLGDQTTVMELHGLYSRLRQTAREASAGPAPNENRARIANEIAESILTDLGARGGTDEVGRAINEARTFSRSLHETFDMGAYARLSRQTVQGDTVTDPRVALDRSVGRGGTGGMVDAENLEAASRGVADPGAPPPPVNETARSAIVDYLRGTFGDQAFTPDASGREVLNRRGATQFVRNNRELLERYPELRQEILEAADQQRTADDVLATIERRIASLEDARRSATAGFANAAQETAVRSIIDAEDPARAAQLVINAARRDETGAALEGVKAAFSDELIRRATVRDGTSAGLDAGRMAELMRDTRFRTAMTRVLAPDEIRRLEEVVRVVGRMNMAQTQQPALPGDSLSGARAPRLIEGLIRIVAVNNIPSSSGQGAGASLQTANIVSNNAARAVQGLTADRASKILADAVTDPRLFQALLMDPASPRFEQEALPRLIPYLVGASASAAIPDEPQEGPRGLLNLPPVRSLLEAPSQPRAGGLLAQ